MSTIPRIERPYTDFSPDLDIQANLEIIVSNDSDLDDNPPNKNVSDTHDFARTTNRAPNSTESSQSLSVNDSQVIADQSADDKAELARLAAQLQSLLPKFAYYNVPGNLAGCTKPPQCRRLKRCFPPTNPPVRNQSVLMANLGFVDSKQSWISPNYIRPEAVRDVYRPFMTILPQDLLKLDDQLTKLTRVEYDIDETDLGMLGFLAVRLGCLLEPEVLEVIMSMLDLSAALICLKMFPKQQARRHLGNSENHSTDSEKNVANSEINSSSVASSTGSAHDRASLSAGEKSLFDYDDNRKCAVCNSASCTDANTILFCDGCDVAVHQDCYGVHSIPEGRWLCRRCSSEGIGAEVDCVLCPHKSGAFKKTATNQWVHLVCALWTPIVLVPENTSLLEPVKNIELVEKERFDLHCYVCRQKHGSCVQCASRDCYSAFHVTCAQAAGFYMTNYDYDIGDILKNQAFLPIYCHRHSVARSGPKMPPPDLAMARQIFAEEQARINQANVSLFALRHHKYWRTANGTLILPQVVVDAVLNGLKRRLNIEIPRAVIEFLCRYWTIKKDNLDGVMFNRHLSQALEIAQHREIRAEQSEEPKQQPQELLQVVEELLAVLKPAEPKSRPGPPPKKMGRKLRNFRKQK